MQHSHPASPPAATDLSASAPAGTSTPASYRTWFSYSGQAPVQHTFEYLSYSWYVDLDRIPDLPWWLRPFLRLNGEDHFAGRWDGSLPDRVRAFVAEHGESAPEGRITALLQGPVRGCSLSLFWCHDRDGTVRHVIATVSTADGGRHACLLPPADVPVLVREGLCPPFLARGGRYLVLAPPPAQEVDVVVSLHHEHRLTFTAALRGQRRPVRGWAMAPRLWLHRAATRRLRGNR